MNICGLWRVGELKEDFLLPIENWACCIGIELGTLWRFRCLCDEVLNLDGVASCRFAVETEDRTVSVE